MKNSRLGVFAVVAVCLLGARIAPSAEAAISILKGPYLQTATTSSIVVMWQTDSACDTRVTYTPSGGTASTVTSATAVTLHQMKLTGLAANTAYTFTVTSVGSAGSVTSPQGSFWTAPTSAIPFRFDVYGDSRTFPADHAKVVAGIVASAPRFVMHTGDIAMDSTIDSEFQAEYFVPAAPALRTSPYYPCLGNHEHESPLYYQYYNALPQGGGTGGVSYYSFNYGNAHVIILDTNITFTPGSAQYNWLVNDLKSTTAEWRFVMHHHPAYSSGSDGPSPAVQSYLVPLYEQYHVDAVFNGHDHLYERSYKNGVTYIVSGGGGADLYPTNVHPNPYQVFAESIHEFVSVDINGTTATLTGRDSSGVAFDSVTLNHKPTAPVASFTGAPTSGAAPLTVHFTDTSTGTPTAWSWTFGDGGTSTAQSPSHSYAAAGSYTVGLTASNTGGSNTATKAGYIVVSAAPPPAPVASFTAAPTSGIAPLTVQFTDTSTNSPTAWSWTFGDGGTSATKSPAHTYSAAGTYTVSLTASNAGGSNTMTRSNYVVASAPPPPAPVAAFSGTPTSGNAPLTVQFTDASTNSPTAWSWSFGDGGTSTAKSPSHTYSAAASYTVSLTASNAGGSNTVTKTGYVTVTAPPPPAPVAAFSGTPTNGTVPLTVQFTDASTNTPTSWSWTFGDGGTSTAKNPSHSYASAGTYTVSLTATNAGGSNTVTKAGYITVTTAAPPAPVAAFSGTPTSGTASLTVQFTDASTNTPTSWSWSFGDGGTSTEQNPSHTYTAAGSYTVSLTATNAGGSNTATKAAYISVTAPPPPAPVANFTATPTSGTAPLSVQFTDTSLASPTAWSWAFGDGGTATAQSPSHSYATAGSYTVSLTATNTGGSDTLTKPGYITVTATVQVPVAGFSAAPTSGTAPLSVQFTDASTNTPASWSWDFGDGTTATQQSPAHTYSAAGSYTVKLTATNSAGANTATKSAYITVSASTPSAPIADFSGTPTGGAAPLSVTFTDTSTGSPTAWQWSFGDGSSATERNPAHAYAAAGSYTVSLTATNAGGSDTTTKAGYVTVTAPAPGVTAEFSAAPLRGSVPVTVLFVNASTGSPTSWQWDFGDKVTSTAKNPTHTYMSPGRYTITLTASANGVSDTVTKKGLIHVGPKDVPVAHWAFDPIVTVWAADLVQGYPGGTYQPSTQVTRDQMAVYLARALAGSDSAVPAGPTTATFSDVPAEHWAYRYVEYLSAAGVVMGYPGGGYHPTDPVTREQMAVYISRAIAVPVGEAGLKSYVPPADPSFPDVTPSSWAYRYVEYAQEHGIVQGFPDGAYHPQDSVTRDQMAVYVQRAFGLPL